MTYLAIGRVWTQIHNSVNVHVNVKCHTCMSASAVVIHYEEARYQVYAFTFTFSDLIILRQAWWRRSYDVIPHRPHRTDRETAAGKA